MPPAERLVIFREMFPDQSDEAIEDGIAGLECRFRAEMAEKRKRGPQELKRSNIVLTVPNAGDRHHARPLAEQLGIAPDHMASPDPWRCRGRAVDNPGLWQVRGDRRRRGKDDGPEFVIR